jgi:uncharacterized protein (DUF427 family)
VLFWVCEMPDAPTPDTSHYPRSPVAAGHVEPSPRRLRGVLDGATILDTQGALYVWEHPHYPQYYVPLADVDPAALERLGDSARVVAEGDEKAPAGTVRIEWDALEAWYEEDERVFVHPRSPYSRVEALRCNRTLRVELEGLVLAEAPSFVKLFETGLPARHYLERTAVDFSHLVPSDTVTSCPYKGTTSAYWSVRVGDELREDLVWSYEFPTPELAKIAGLVAFYDEKVDLFLDGVQLERPRTPFS